MKRHHVERHRLRVGPREILLGAVLAIASPAALWGYQWPVANQALTATFGESRSDHFHSGIDIAGGDQEVHPVEAGEIIFTYKDGQHDDPIPTGLGNFVVVEHSGGMRSVYAHLKENSLIQGKTSVTTDDVLGVIGDSGATQGKQLYLSVIDTEFHRFVNPLLLLPPLEDNRQPVIQGVYLVRGNQTITLADGMTVKSGEAGLVVDTYDPSQYVDYFCPMAPYEIDAFANGKQIASVTYESLEEKNGEMQLVPSDVSDFKSYYLDDRKVRIGTVPMNVGETLLDIVVKDFAGNEKSVSFSLSVHG